MTSFLLLAVFAALGQSIFVPDLSHSAIKDLKSQSASPLPMITVTPIRKRSGPIIGHYETSVNIEIHSAYLTESAGTTVWKGADDAPITQTVTKSESGKSPQSTVIAAPVALVATGDGEFDFIMNPQTVKDIMTKAIQKGCGITSTKMMLLKRDSSLATCARQLGDLGGMAKIGDPIRADIEAQVTAQFTNAARITLTAGDVQALIGTAAFTAVSVTIFGSTLKHILNPISGLDNIEASAVVQNLKKEEKKNCPGGDDSSKWPSCNDSTCNGIFDGSSKPKCSVPGKANCQCRVHAVLTSIRWGSIDLWDIMEQASKDAKVKVDCQKSTKSLSQADVRREIDSFCNSIDGHEVSTRKGGIDRAFKMISVNNPAGYWLFVQSIKGTGCPETTKITKDDCSFWVTQAMETCDPRSGESHGGTISSDCMSYGVTLDDSATNPQSPPWNRAPVTSSPRPATQALFDGCTKVSSGVPSDFWEAFVPIWCDKIDKEKKKDQQVFLTSKDLTDPAKKGMYTDKQFEFVYYYRKNPRCSDDCRAAYHVLAQSDCGKMGDQKNAMTTYGNVDVACANYAFWIK